MTGVQTCALPISLVERDALYDKDPAELTDEDGMRLGELEGVVGEEGGYEAESDAAILLTAWALSPASMNAR